jgi:carbon starvation protein
MFPFLVVIFCFLIYFLGYKYYSNYLSVKVFDLQDSSTQTPAHIYRDDKDYIPTKPSILFGHHFASIAGLAPILGPAVGVVWGWLPAMIWIVLGGLFVGCVHDMGSLVVSVRSGGHSMGKVAYDNIGYRARSLFHLVIFFLVALSMGVFLLVIAGLYTPESKIPNSTQAIQVQKEEIKIFSKDLKNHHDDGNLVKETSRIPNLRNSYPESVPPTIALVILAMIVGFLHYKKNYSLKYLTIISLVIVMFVIYLSIDPNILTLSGLNNPEIAPSVDSWKLILLLYAFIASITPAWLLLQSRDYINSFLLYLGIGLVYLGFFLGSFRGELSSFHVTYVRTDNIGLDIIPFVFITIACGAVSGFHSLVSSGTTAKQLSSEKDARAIGYGGMIGESLLGLTSVIACTVGFQSDQDWMAYYKSWSGLQGLSVQVGAYIEGTGRFLSFLGIPKELGHGYISLVVVSFALTSLDSGTRLLRYNIEEIFHSIPILSLKKVMVNKWITTSIACGAISFFAFLKIEVGGQIKPAGLSLWKLFGTTNQLLAGLSLMAITIYLFRCKKNYFVTLIPMSFVLGVTIWAMLENMIEFIFMDNPNYLLGFVGSFLFVLAIWLVVEGLIVVQKIRREN